MFDLVALDGVKQSLGSYEQVMNEMPLTRLLQLLDDGARETYIQLLDMSIEKEKDKNG